MDTSKETSPEMGNPAESSEESTQETSSSPEEGTEGDKLYAGKYKSVEELEKGYQELQRHSTKVEMDRAELLKAREVPEDNVAFPVEENATGETTQQDTMKILNRIIDQRTQPLKEQLQLNEVFQKYQDFPQYAKEAAKLIKDRPHLSWEEAYRYVKFDDRAREAREEGRKEAYAKIGEKQAATTPATKAKESKERPVEELLSDRSVKLSDIEKMLPHA